MLSIVLTARLRPTAQKKKLISEWHFKTSEVAHYSTLNWWTWKFINLLLASPKKLKPIFWKSGKHQTSGQQAFEDLEAYA